MTIIVWDGTTLAADRQCTRNDIARSATKVRRVGDTIAAATGDQLAAMAMLHWWETGAQPEAWPDTQAIEDKWSTMLVVRPSGWMTYERLNLAIDGEDPYFAMGWGQDLAYGAMMAGADAIRAVQIACAFNVGCGMGIDWLRLDGSGGRLSC